MIRNSVPFFLAIQGKIQGEKIVKTFLGYNFLLECPTDLRSTPLSLIENHHGDDSNERQLC